MVHGFVVHRTGASVLTWIAALSHNFNLHNINVLLGHRTTATIETFFFSGNADIVYPSHK
jgi:hypothetical protein